MKRPTPSDKTASGKVTAPAAGRPQGVPSADDQTTVSSAEFIGSGAAKSASSQACSSVTGGSIPLPKRATFPVKLHAILSRPDLSNIISWCEDGAAFRVEHPKEFAGNVLPCYFDHNNFSSFLRKVRGWGFKRIKSGPDAGSYYHPLFHRDKPYLALRMKRQMANSSAYEPCCRPMDPKLILHSSCARRSGFCRPFIFGTLRHSIQLRPGRTWRRSSLDFILHNLQL